jgi:hypothetical protein
MFCRTCGTSVPNDGAVCLKCGAAQNAQDHVRQTYRPLNLESKIVDVYPSKKAEREAIEFFESTGWILSASAKTQDTKMNKELHIPLLSASVTTKIVFTTSTCTRMTFQRDRNMPAYERIKELSEDAESFFGMISKVSLVDVFVRFLFAAIFLVGGILSLIYIPNILGNVGLIVAAVSFVLCIIMFFLWFHGIRQRKRFNYAKRDADIKLVECRELVEEVRHG